MKLYLKKAKQMVELFQEVKIKQISWNKNYRADMLARMAIIVDPKLPKSVPLEVRTSPSIGEEVEVMQVSTEESWMDLILSYIREHRSLGRTTIGFLQRRRGVAGAAWSPTTLPGHSAEDLVIHSYVH